MDSGKLKLAVPDDHATTMDDKTAKGKAGGLTGDDDAAEPDSQEELFFSDFESGSESIEIADLKKRMWKDQLLLMKLEGRSGRDNRGALTDATGCLAWEYPSFNCCVRHCRGGGDAVLQRQPCPDQHQIGKVEEKETPEARYRRKAMLRAQDGVLRHMLKMMEACNARGFVYGVVDEDGVPVSGSSDSLRGWWKDDVGFDRTGPMALLSGSDPGSPMAAASFLHGLHDIQDSTLGSLLSALIQHCEPPQRSFPLDRGLPPPWWPTGIEPWWGLQGEAQAHQGVPPYRKPHDLKKAWKKISLLSGVIKHLSPRFDQMRKLVWQSKRLQHKMSDRDAETWATVIAQEEALDRRVQRALQITPLDNEDDHDDGDPIPPQEAAHLDKRKRRAGGDEDVGGSGSEMQMLPLPDIESVTEVDRNSIDELMKLYYRCLQGTDGVQDMDAAGVGDAGQSQSSVGETAQDARLHDDMFDGLQSVADVVDVSDFQNSPIWQWFYD